jgi:hypothetical protein
MSEISLDLDDELIRARFMQGVGNGAFLPQISIPTPAGISPLSSICSSDADAPIPQHRPSLSPPEQNIMFKILKANTKTEELTAKKAQIFDLETSSSIADNNRIFDEKQKALQEEAEAAKARTTYSTLSNVAQYVTSVGFIAVGAAVGGIPGAVMVASGVIGVGTRIADDTKFLDAAVKWYTKSEELQRSLTRDIEMAAFILQMGLGLASGFAAWQAGGLAMAAVDGANILSTTRNVVTGAGTVMSITGQVGTRYYDKRMAYLQANMKEMDTKTVLNHQALYHDSAEMNKIIEAGQSQTEEARKMIKAQEISQDLVG